MFDKRTIPKIEWNDKRNIVDKKSDKINCLYKRKSMDAKKI